MVSYILFVAVFNVCLGFAAGVHLGRRHRLLRALGPQRTHESALANGLAGWGHRAVATASATSPPLDLPTENPPAAPPTASSSPGFEETSLPPAAATPPPQPSAGEKSVAALRREVSQYEGQVAEANDALRSYTGVADAAAIEACLNSLLEATNSYLQHREELQKGFQRLPEEQPKVQEIHAKVQVAIQHQDAQIQSATDSIVRFNSQDDPEAGCMQVVGETSKLMDANHHLRDTLDVALVEVARNQERSFLVDQAAESDPLTGIAGRAGVEAQLCRWWQDDPQRARCLSVAMIDIDHFSEINQHFGHKVGNKLLRAVGQLLAAERRGEATAARFAGQSFLLLLPDADVRLATSTAERIRQTIEMARFRCGGDELRLTVSCAVTGTTAEDTTATLLARAEATLREAKRYGRNRTFLHEDKYPAPVVPPNFSLEAKELIL